jgi:WD40 repeat protein
MRIWRAVTFPFLCCCALLLATSAFSQQSCPPAPVPAIRGTNIFDSQQEAYLGDVQAEQLQHTFRVIDDPTVTAYLQKIGDRIAQHMPANSLNFQFVLYDQPEATAFGMAGGRIYVSRKLVSFMKSEDELAGVLGHELGHIAGHHSAIDVSTYFREILGVTAVTDREDIFEKYNQFLDNAAKKPAVFKEASKHEEPDQLIADNFGLYLTSTAGFNPRATIEMWDRMAGTKGKTGSAVSDFFGAIRPDEKRLRELERGLTEIPGPCGEAPVASVPGEFSAWQTAVLRYSGLGHRESLHNVKLKRTLDPPIRGDMRFLRFSPDGKYLLAQDYSSIFVLTREPFAVAFRIDAPEANAAVFSSDSQNISFYTKSLRIETWSLADQARTDLHELVIKNGCVQSELSPDGAYLSCYGFGEEFLDLRIFETSSGESVFEKKNFYYPRSMLEIVMIWGGLGFEVTNPRIINMRFSPDSHYFIAAAHNETELAFDLTTKKTISLPGSVKKLLGVEFEFLTADKLVGINPINPEKSGVVSFPQGEMVEEVPIETRNLQTSSHGDYVLMRPIKQYPVGVLNLKTKKIFAANTRDRYDVFEDFAVDQRIDGELVLKHASSDEDISKVLLPRSPLAPLRAFALSQDLKYLAVSEESRGGVWDLPADAQVFNARGFAGGFFGTDGIFYGDFHGFQGTDRSITKLDPKTLDANIAYKLDEKSSWQSGKFLMVEKASKPGTNQRGHDMLDVRDVVTGKSLWTHTFPQGMPRVFIDSGNDTMALAWTMSSKEVQIEIAANPDLAKRAEGKKKDDASVLIEVVDGQTGKYRGGTVVNTNKVSFRLADIFATSDTLLVGDSENRILVYSLATGEQIAKVFGHGAEVSAASGLVVMENETGQILIYDMAKMEKRDELRFNSPIASKQFSGDGKRLFVLTAAQDAYVIDLSSIAQPAVKTTAGSQ